MKTLVALLLLIPSLSWGNWQIDKSENTYSLTRNGEVTDGNAFVFTFNGNNDCRVDAYFLMYTLYNKENLMTLFEDKSLRIYLAGNETPVSMRYSFDFAGGQISILYLTYQNYFSKTFITMTEDLLKEDILEIEIHEDYKKYYDISYEFWNFKNFKERINETYRMCLKDNA